MNSEKNTYVLELNKCRGQEVEVYTKSGKVLKGVCREINFTHLNVILMDKTKKIYVKDIDYMVRKRTNPEVTTKKVKKTTKNETH